MGTKGVSCSPLTAVFLFNRAKRLRFQNLGKPRTAGLCGRAAGACDCGPLSCAFIERPSPLEKLSCKVRFFTQTHSRKYRQKVTATTLFQITFHRGFSTSRTNGPRSLSWAKAGTHATTALNRAHSGLRGETGGVSDGGGMTTLGAFHTVRKPCVAGYQNGKLCRFWVSVRCAPEERRKPSGQRCA